MFNIMYPRYILTIAAFIILLMVAALYFSKPKLNNKLKHRVYAILILSNISILVFELLIMVLMGMDISYNICVIAFNLRDYSMMVYFTVILIYYYSAVNEKQYKNVSAMLQEETFTGEKRRLLPHFIITMIFIVVHLFLPYNYATKETYNFAFGGWAYYLTILYSVISTLETLYITIIVNRNHSSFTERVSLIWLFSLMLVILIFQVVFSEITVMGIVSAIYILGLYFLLENPDLELVEEINTLTGEVEQANRTKLDFLTNVSKEMKSPIKSIVNLSEDVLKYNSEDNQKLYDDIRQIELSSKNFLEIVNNALDMSNAENEKEEIFETNYSLSTLLTGLINIAEEKIGSKKVKLIVNADETIPNNLYGDSTKIHQILLNVLSNAIKYTEVGKVTLTLTKEIKNTVIVLKFKITDTGMGIKQEDYEKIFEKYSRLDDAVSRGIEGTGLGLTITKKYVDLLNGKISVDSEYGAGATFYIEIPQQIVDMTNTIGNFQESEEKKADVKETIDCSKYKILIVEDNKLDLEVTKRLFNRYKFQIESCTNGKDCIFRYKKGEHYDMILLDHVMPEMTGIEVMQIIRKLKDYEAPPLVALTANTFVGSKDKYIQEGFDEYLPKPIDLIELDALVNKYFKKEN